MAATRSIIRAAAQRFDTPGQVLQRVNDLLCPDIPPNMFATCQYCILDIETGRMVFANAGHNLPYLHTPAGVEELKATGMPLGLLPGMLYEETEIILKPGDSLLFHSDGLVEAHNDAHEMFGFPHLKELVGEHGARPDIIDFLREQLTAFTGRERDQEDDVTLVALSRSPQAASPTAPAVEAPSSNEKPVRILDSFEIPSEPGNERLAIERVATAIADVDLPAGHIDRLKTAVGEATMNAMEHGNKYQADVPVLISVSVDDHRLRIEISDSAGEQPIPSAQTPDLDAKLAGLQTPRGWGLFLIENMVDELHTRSEGVRHTMELVFHLGGGTTDGR
jgi:anti-sigma regulatory factor (Ser/Thr protein kinase)